MTYAINDGDPVSINIKAGEVIDSSTKEHLLDGSSILCMSPYMTLKSLYANFGITTNIRDYKSIHALMLYNSEAPWSMGVISESISERDTIDRLKAKVRAMRRVHQKYGDDFMVDHEVYLLSCRINEVGPLLDTKFASAAKMIDLSIKSDMKKKFEEVTGIDNPRSRKDFMRWLSVKTQRCVNSTSKAYLEELMSSTDNEDVKEAIDLNISFSKTSTNKYDSLLNNARNGSRLSYAYKYYGARTGRWSSTGAQLHNLPRTSVGNIDLTRELVLRNDTFSLDLVVGNAIDALSSLVRTSIVAPDGCMLAAADFSSIESIVLAWMAGAEWKLEAFRDHGMIYEAVASRMLNKDIKDISKKERNQGKVSELALGYQGGYNALVNMSKALGVNISDSEIYASIKSWRDSNREVVNLWSAVENSAKEAIRSNGAYRSNIYSYRHNNLYIKLPSGRSLCYRNARVEAGEIIFDRYLTDKPEATYGGKLVENITQGIARDLLAAAMLRLDSSGFKIVMHTHDEVVCEVPESCAEKSLEVMLELMIKSVNWSSGLPLKADGFISKYYK